MPDFTVTPTVRDGITVLVLEGELDMATTPTLEAALSNCPADGPVVADLTPLRFVDSTGLHLLLQGPQAAGPAALVCPPASHISRVLQLIDARKTIPVYDELTDAIRDLEDSAA
jgi:anti-sigma B factor antagonist